MCEKLIDLFMNRKIIFEHVSQRYDYDCGVAAVNTLIMMLGREKLPADELEKRLGTTPDLGTSPVNIKRVLDEEKIDYMESRNGKFEDLEKMIGADFVCLVVYQAWWTEKEKD